MGLATPTVVPSPWRSSRLCAPRWRRTPIFLSLQAQGVTSHREATHGRPSLRKRDPSDVYGDGYGPRCRTPARDMCRCTHDVRSIRVHQPSVDPLAYRETETRGEAPHSHGVSATRTNTIPPVRAASRAARRPSLTIVIVGRRRPPGRRLEPNDSGTDLFIFNRRRTAPGAGRGAGLEALTARLTEGPLVLGLGIGSNYFKYARIHGIIPGRRDDYYECPPSVVQRERLYAAPRLMSATSDVSAVG